MTYSLDSNHTEIVNAFRDLGAMAYVVDNAKVKRYEPGQLDLWVGLVNPSGGYGCWIWVEVKTGEGRLTSDQWENVRQCRDRGLPVEVVRSVDDVKRIYEHYQEVMKGE